MSRFSTASGDAPEAALARFQQAVRRRDEDALAQAALVLKTEIQRQLSTPGRGRYYAKAARVAGESPMGPRAPAEATKLRQRRQGVRRLNAKRRATAAALNSGAIEPGAITSRRILTGLHRASQPGDPPAPDTGTLRRSAFVERTERGVRVGVAMPYGVALELGTTGAGRGRNVTIAPRPFMRPALAVTRAQLGDVFRVVLRVGVR